MAIATPARPSQLPTAFLLVVAALTALACDDGGEWSRVSGIDKDVDFNAIWGSSTDDVWAVGESDSGSAIWHRDGERWREQTPPDADQEINDVWGTAGGVWIAGHGGVHRLNGSVWESWPGVDAVAIWGTGPNQIFAAGSRRVWRFDGETWTEEPSAHELSEFEDLELVGIWGAAADAVWVVGGRVVCECGATTALYRSATTWSLVSLGTEMFIKDVWGAGPNDVFAVGGSVFSEEGSGIFRFDGQSWSKVGSGKAEFLSGIWGRSANDVYAVGMGGEIRHFDGSAWQKMASGTNRNLRDVWGDPAGTVVYTVGTAGTILRRDR